MVMLLDANPERDGTLSVQTSNRDQDDRYQPDSFDVPCEMCLECAQCQHRCYKSAQVEQSTPCNARRTRRAVAPTTQNQAELLFIALQSRVHTAKLRATLAQPRQPVASSRSRSAYSTDGHDSMMCSNRN